MSTPAMASRVVPTEKTLKAQIRALELEIADLQSSVHSLDELHDKLSAELLDFEAQFKSQMLQSIVPLLQWPTKRSSLSAKSWVDLQKSGLLLEELKRRMLMRPLKLMADRELRISEVKKLREDLASQLEEMQSRQALLDLQLDELSSLKRGKSKRPPRARSSKKLRIGDIEENGSKP